MTSRVEEHVGFGWDALVVVFHRGIEAIRRVRQPELGAELPAGEVNSMTCGIEQRTIGRPRACGVPKGRRYTFSLYTRPAEVKNSTGARVEATNTWLRKSSSRIAIPARPRPPRRCER